ncbi:hypothetical protein ACVXHA_15280 [Escherichia coli]
MNFLPTAYAPRQGESLGKHSLQKIDAIPEEVRSAIDDGLNDIRFNGYRWECNAKQAGRVYHRFHHLPMQNLNHQNKARHARADFLRYKVSIYQSRRKLKARRIGY